MQVERTIDAASRVVILTVTGDLGNHELLALADELARSGVGSDYSLLIDLRQASGRNVTSAGVRELVERPLVFSAASRRAVVVPSDLGFGMARMYELLRENRGGGATQVFRDFDQARRWLETGAP
jgi:hypothetical protein